MKSGSQSRHKILFESTTVASESLPDVLGALSGCWKSSSILWMHVNHFPTLPGLILTGWSSLNGQAVLRFSQLSKFSELLLRIEKPGQRWTRRRGGYNVPLAKVKQAIEALADDGFIAILLEPASPYSDLYSLTSVCDVDKGEIDLEVVGPGFDASDALRSDLTPHERFQMVTDTRALLPWDREHVRINRTHLIDSEKYRASVRRRLVKIGARLKNPAFPDEWMDSSLPASTMNELVQDATRYLKESGQTTLLEHLDHYQGIPAHLLNMFLDQLLRLCQMVAGSKMPWRTFSLAGSFLPNERLVIWDFFAPGTYDTLTLSRLTA